MAEKCDPRRVYLGELNPYQFRKDALKVTKTASWYELFQQAIGRSFSPDALDGTGPYKALCLKVEKDATETAGTDTSYFGFFGKTPRYKVWARIPELHAGIPDPCVYSSRDDITPSALYAILMHPIFVAENPTGGPGTGAGASTVEPAVGDILWVKFEHQNNQTQGIYLGKCSDGTKGMPFSCDDGTKGLFDDGGNVIGTVGSTTSDADLNDLNCSGNSTKLQPISMDISDAGKKELMSFEGFKTVVYDDLTGKELTSFDGAKGAPHIGVGHLIYIPGQIDERTKYQGYLKGVGAMTRSQVEDLFTEDLKTYVDAVKRGVTTSLSQNQFDALVSLVYNVGASSFLSSSLLKKLNSGDCKGAINSFLDKRFITAYHQVNQNLISRRKQEAAKFATG